MHMFASLMAVCFGFVTIQPLYGDPCPHHQPALAALAQGLGTGPGASHAMGAHDGMAGGGEHGTHGAAGHGSSGDSHHCNCFGACCGVAPVALAQLPAAWVAVALARRVSVSSSAATARAPQPSPRHTLPFATAPPPALLV